MPASRGAKKVPVNPKDEESSTTKVQNNGNVPEFNKDPGRDGEAQPPTPRHQASTTTANIAKVTFIKLEQGGKQEDLNEWDHMEMSTFGTTATVRTVASTAAKGLYFCKVKIKNMGRNKEQEMRKANAVIDKLDKLFEPKLKGKLSFSSLEDEKE